MMGHHICSWSEIHNNSFEDLPNFFHGETPPSFTKHNDLKQTAEDLLKEKVKTMKSSQKIKGAESDRLSQQKKFGKY